MKFPGKPCAGKLQARFEAEGSGEILTFTLHEGEEERRDAVPLLRSIATVSKRVKETGQWPARS